MDPAARFPEPNDDIQAPKPEPTPLPPGQREGSRRKVTVSLTVEMEESGPVGAAPRGRIRAGALVRAAIGDRVRGLLGRLAQPPTTSTTPSVGPAQPSEPEQAAGPPEGSRPPPVSFWAVLNPAEREALTAAAERQVFPAGQTLMREGDVADHVMVIMEGRVEVVVDENGWERALAERGPGDLVGERGGLQVRTRSASVIALEAVQVLTVRTEDFQTFVNAHPKVFDIVERQLYDRLTEAPARPRDPRPPKSDSQVTAADATAPLGLNGQHCTILYSDVVGFSSPHRNDADRLVIRRALGDVTRMTLQKVPGAWSQDRGDGLLTVIPPSIPTADVVGRLHRELPWALSRHNLTDREQTRFQLRIAIAVGPVTSDSMGVSGEAIIVAARLLQASAFKDAITAGQATLGVIASRFVYDAVIRHCLDPLELAGFAPVPVEVKGFATIAWMKLFNGPIPPIYFYRPVVPGSSGVHLMARELN